MRHVILRDDDTNALTPVECLERLYRPFLERGLPVNLAVIPNVRADAVRTDGELEQFLSAGSATDLFVAREPPPGFGLRQSTAAFEPLPGHRERQRTAAVQDAIALNDAQRLPIGENQKLVSYLQENPGFHVAQHGFDHSLFEFDSASADDVCDRLERGTRLLMEAGFLRPQTFVAPYDKFSTAALREAAKRFRVISASWFEWRRLPCAWRPRYALKKLLKRPHWRVGKTFLLSHPGCLLSRDRSRATMLDAVKKSVASRPLTVLVTHWWEYFPDGTPDEMFIQVLHETAEWLATEPGLKVIAFDDLAANAIPTF